MEERSITIDGITLHFGKVVWVEVYTPQIKNII